MSLDDKSERLLQGVHPDLCSVVRRAREITEFRLTEGLRSLARQKQLKAQGKSRTLNSRHLTGHAVDVVDLKGSYAEAEMKRIAEAMKAAAIETGVAITWGGNWSTFCDTPHFELEWHAYPASSFAAKVKAAVGGIAAGGVVIPSVPSVITDNAASISGWQGAVDQITGLATWATLSPLVLGMVGLAVVLGWVVPRLANTGENE
jgi:peptidoglycan L-alanyl-D-glutamate endopeptidase CwlK